MDERSSRKRWWWGPAAAWRASRLMVRHDVAESAGADGNAAQRGSQRHEQEIAYLRRKWGRYLDVVQAKGHL